MNGKKELFDEFRGMEKHPLDLNDAKEAGFRERRNPVRFGDQQPKNQKNGRLGVVG